MLPELKPEHIVLNQKGVPHMIIANSVKFNVIGDTKVFKGNLEYFSPELVKSQPLGIAHDYWCLGVLLYEMLFGPTPYECEDRKKSQLFIEKLEVNFPDNIEIQEDTKTLIRSMYFIKVNCLKRIQ